MDEASIFNVLCY